MTRSESGEWILYGANGYTGQLVAALAAERGLRPVLAGRSADKLRPLAERLSLPGVSSWAATPRHPTLPSASKAGARIRAQLDINLDSRTAASTGETILAKGLWPMVPDDSV